MIDGCRLLFSILIPPLGVFLKVGLGGHFWLNIFLTILGYVIVCIALLAIYGQVPIETAGSFGLCLLFAGSVLAVTFFLSSVSKGAMGATVITLVFIMVISGVLEGILAMADLPSWFLLSTAGDSIGTVYGGYEAFMPGDTPHGMPEAPDIGLCILSMAIYLVVGFILSIWITKRRQLA